MAALIIFFSVESFGQSHDIEVIEKLNRDWLNTYPKKDSATLSKILADDFIMIASNGYRQTKKDNLMNLLSPNIETISVTIDSVNTRMLTREVGLLNAWITFVFKADGKEMTGHNCYQDIYMKRKGEWVAVAAHVTLLNSH